MIEAILALVVMAYALAAARLNRLSVGPALFFVVTGMVAAIGWTGSLPTVDAEVVLRLVELTLALILFTDASTIDLVGLRREADLAVRLLSVGLLLSIGAGHPAGRLRVPGAADRRPAAGRCRARPDRCGARAAGGHQPGRCRSGSDGCSTPRAASTTASPPRSSSSASRSSPARAAARATGWPKPFARRSSER